MMGAAIDPHAAAICVRDTLGLFLADHPGLEHADVEVAEHVEVAGNFGITIDGFALEIDVRWPGSGSRVLDALSAELTDWLRANDLQQTPGDAYEILHGAGLNEGQQRWLSDFIMAWELAELRRKNAEGQG